MKTEEYGLFTRGWETGLPKNKRAWIKEKKDSDSVEPEKKFYAKGFTVQNTGALWNKNIMLRI